jgi:hypothetical protein
MIEYMASLLSAELVSVSFSLRVGSMPPGPTPCLPRQIFRPLTFVVPLFLCFLSFVVYVLEFRWLRDI